MGLDQLDTPLRVTWDLHGPGFNMPVPLVETILGRLDEAGVFFVHLELSPLAHSACGHVLRHLSGRGRQVVVMCSGTENELANLPAVEDRGDAVVLRVEPFAGAGRIDFGRLLSVLRILRQAGIEPGLSLTPDRDNLAFLPALLEFCQAYGITRLKLPNARIDGSFQQVEKDRIPTAKDIETVRQTCADTTRLTEGIALEIHDLFLWEILSPGDQQSRTEYGGCQAANSLAHIAGDGTVTPCLTWPEPLGNLAEQSFHEIWASERCRSVRRRIAAQPSGCAGCRDYPSCFGGCRGLAGFLDVDEGLDPACSGPR